MSSRHGQLAEGNCRIVVVTPTDVRDRLRVCAKNRKRGFSDFLRLKFEELAVACEAEDASAAKVDQVAAENRLARRAKGK
jgi:hypothetical protein